VIVHANDSPRAVALASALAELKLDPGFAPETCLVIGGDGTMLRAIQQHGTRWSYLGINCGHLGFLMNEIGGTDDEVARRVVTVLGERRYQAPSFPRLALDVLDGARRAEVRALNDVYVERQMGQCCHLRVTVDDVAVVDRMVCDGIVAATPLGSTAYSFSAGGSAAHPLIRALHLTPICPHTPRLAPIVLPFGSIVRVEVLEPERRAARAVADGIQHADVRLVEIRASGDEVRLCFLDGHNFTKTMIRKILHP
jgi:NAD+ kinase